MFTITGEFSNVSYTGLRVPDSLDCSPVVLPPTLPYDLMLRPARREFLSLPGASWARNGQTGHFSKPAANHFPVSS